MAIIADMQLLSAIAASSDGQHSVNACTGEVRLVVVVEVVCEQDVECRLVVSVAVTVPPALTVKFAEDIGGRRDARTLQRTEKPPPKHAVIELDTTHRNSLLYSQIQHTADIYIQRLFYIISAMAKSFENCVQ